MLPQVKRAISNEELNQCLSIRHKVFVEGQKVPLEEEVDGKDDSSLHYLLFLSTKPVGVARVRCLNHYGKIERVAILDEHQGQGFGAVLMKQIIEDLRQERTMTQAKLSAQTNAIPFYEKLGFEVCSDEYMDAGIPHKDMIYIF